MWYYPMQDVTLAVKALERLGYQTSIEKTTVERLVVRDNGKVVVGTIISDAAGFRQVATSAFSHLREEPIR
jgi:hypothetical protein